MDASNIKLAWTLLNLFSEAFWPPLQAMPEDVRPLCLIYQQLAISVQSNTDTKIYHAFTRLWDRNKASIKIWTTLVSLIYWHQKIQKQTWHLLMKLKAGTLSLKNLASWPWTWTSGTLEYLMIGFLTNSEFWLSN